MQAIGILLLTIGAWIVYCGFALIDPWKTAVAIMQNPGNAAQIIADAKSAGVDKAKAFQGAVDALGNTSSYGNGATGIRVNPYALLPITTKFGEPDVRGLPHPGIDYATPVGTPLIALASGTVTNSAASGAGGWTVSEKMADGYTLVYYHVSKFVPSVNGKSVKGGTVIGYSGGAAGVQGSGNSTGPHIHLEIDGPKGAIDPNIWFDHKENNVAQKPGSVKDLWNN